MGSLVQIVVCIPVQEQVVADTATDKRTLDFRHSVHFFVYIQQRCVICIQILADDRRDARRFLALGADIRFFPFIRYILAEGPPRSLRYPLKSGIRVISFTSFNMDSLLREAINFP